MSFLEKGLIMEINYIDILKNTMYEEEINSEEYLEILAKWDKV